MSRVTLRQQRLIPLAVIFLIVGFTLLITWSIVEALLQRTILHTLVCVASVHFLWPKDNSKPTSQATVNHRGGILHGNSAVRFVFLQRLTLGMLLSFGMTTVQEMYSKLLEHNDQRDARDHETSALLDLSGQLDDLRRETRTLLIHTQTVKFLRPFWGRKVNHPTHQARRGFQSTIDIRNSLNSLLSRIEKLELPSHSRLLLRAKLCDGDMCLIEGRKADAIERFRECADGGLRVGRLRALVYGDGNTEMDEQFLEEFQTSSTAMYYAGMSFMRKKQYSRAQQYFKKSRLGDLEPDEMLSITELALVMEALAEFSSDPTTESSLAVRLSSAVADARDRISGERPFEASSFQWLLLLEDVRQTVSATPCMADTLDEYHTMLGGYHELDREILVHDLAELVSGALTVLHFQNESIENSKLQGYLAVAKRPSLVESLPEELIFTSQAAICTNSLKLYVDASQDKREELRASWLAAESELSRMVEERSEARKIPHIGRAVIMQVVRAKTAFSVTKSEADGDLYRDFAITAESYSRVLSADEPIVVFLESVLGNLRSQNP